VRRSDFIFLHESWAESKGATQEVEWAVESCVPRFESLPDLLEWRDRMCGA
jgi:hypothetical protein